MSKPTRLHLSRRALLEGGLLVGASLLLPQILRAADSDSVNASLARLPLITKRIPSTHERLPAIGIGTNAFYLAQYEELRRVLKLMHEMGGAVIDTSDDYPNPAAEESELVIGRALAELQIRNQMFLVTKFNADGFQMARSPRDTIFGREAFDRSLERLQTSKVDLQYIHHVPSIDPLLPLLKELKKAGNARYIGMSMLRVENLDEFIEKMKEHPVDFVEVPYSLGNRAVASALLPLALKRRIGVMVDVPLQGLKNVLDRPLPSWAADIDVTSWAQFMLKYAISHPAITCVIPGATKVDHLIENQLAGRGRLPDAATRTRMEEYWDSVTTHAAA
jgi:aryl-alcohol dehydrogenase-like predicted oxidoreductase